MVNRSVIAKSGILVLLVLVLVACGGSDSSAPGSSAAPTQEPQLPLNPTPPPDNGRPPVAYADAEALFAAITAATINSDGNAVVDFQVADGTNTAIVDVTTSDLAFTLAKLQPSYIGNLTGSWQSYINRIEAPSEMAPRLQATSESNGVLENHLDGTYTYTFANSVLSQSAEIEAQAAAENLDLAYHPLLTHRVAIQFRGSRDTANPVYDWQPDSGETSNLFHQRIVATASCNTCHDKLALHGGTRVETDFCVTCHNSGSTDANSGNTVDFKVMVHKIHMGHNLPSVQAGGSYVIYGYRDSAHDYSELGYPQDIRNCTKCHAGNATAPDLDNPAASVALTQNGDNWSEYASMAVCGSCHDDLDFSQHFGGQVNNDNCMSCHSVNGPAGTIASSHRIATAEASAQLAAAITGVTNSAPGETPMISFRLFNPLTDENYALTDDLWANGRLSLTLSWSTRDYTNTGNGADDASSVSVSVASAVDNGDGSYTVTAPMAIPDGSATPGVAASGSGTVIIEGRAAMDTNGDGSPENVSLTNAHGFFSIDEADAVAVPRRTVADLDKCLVCHQSLSLHGGNRTDNLQSCVTCHNPRNTDHEVRAVAANPPTDGKAEQSLDFKTMVHGIHAAAIRENPLQIVGYRGFSTYVFDESHVHYPGNIADCSSCHDGDSYTLPLADGVLASTVDTGADKQDPADDLFTTPTTAVCSSCHDSAAAMSHMALNGGSFSATQAELDSGLFIETCATCHGEGQSVSVSAAHSQ